MLKEIIELEQSETSAHEPFIWSVISSESEAGSSRAKKYEQEVCSSDYDVYSYLEKNVALKFSPQKVLAGCQSVVVLGLNYNTVKKKNKVDEYYISQYADMRDYHKVLKSRIKRIVLLLHEKYPNEEFRYFCDSSPLNEKQLGIKAGFGFVGNNTLLINPVYGSRLFLGEILSTKKFSFDYTNLGQTGESLKGCEDCTLCIDSCPTGALLGNNSMNPKLCISHQTIENHGSIPFELQPKIGDNIFGCDICQAVCPYNESLPITKEGDFLKSIPDRHVSLEEILQLKNHTEFVAIFAGSPVMMAKRSGIVRNALIVAMNKKRYDLLPFIELLVGDADSVVAEQAKLTQDSLR